MGVTGDEPEEALDLVEAGRIGQKRMCQRGLRASQLLGCLWWRGRQRRDGSQTGPANWF